MEIWKTIEGFENYAVSNQGNVKRLAFYSTTKTDKIIHHKELILLPQYSKNKNHLVVYLNKGGKYKMKAVSVLVADAFLENPKHKRYVINKDGDYKNCNVENLEYSNHLFGKNAKKVICEGMIFNSISECAMYYELGIFTLSNYLTGKKPMPKKFIEMGLAYYQEKD